ncbi:MAG: IPT/TIG domain-containing protein [Bacteroidaceae bacterium]|nr:IPT/TIG domain-containing protein [Bacteroidaceae bacterium]
MKKIFRYLNIATLLVVLSAMFVACADTDNDDNGNLGLNIKVFSPTVVVPGQPMTINGSGFGDVTEIEFPGEINVTDFEIVTNEMIRVKAPIGLNTSGQLLVRNASGETATSRLSLTIGHTTISGYSAREYKEGGKVDKDYDVVKGNTLLTVYGTGMQFMSSAEFIDEDGNPIVVNASEFHRVAPGRVVIQVPAKVLTGNFSVKLRTIDDNEFETPVFAFETAQDGGHWEYTRRFLWQNESGKEVAGWSSIFRIGLEGTDPDKACMTTVDEETWTAIKDGEEVYFLFEGSEASNVRITTGWWSAAYGGPEHNSIDMAIDDEETGKKLILLNFKADGNLYDLLDAQHLLFTGDAYKPLGLFVVDKKWIEGGGGHFETVRESFWKNDGSIGKPEWKGYYRFGLDGHDGNNECATTFDEETWIKFMTEPIRIAIEKTGDADPNVRVTTGWWSSDFGGKEYNWYQNVEQDDNGNMFIELNLANDADFVALLEAQHLLFTGDDYKIIEIYQEKEIWVEGGDAKPTPIVLWENNTTIGALNWNSDYRFSNVETITKEVIHAFSMEEWSIIKDGTFYLLFDGDETSNLRITTGWWNGAYGGPEHNSIDIAEDDPDTGKKIIKINLKEDGNLYDNVDAQHLLFTGGGYTPLKIFYYK